MVFRAYDHHGRKVAAIAVIMTLTFVGFFVGIRQRKSAPEYRVFSAGNDVENAALARSNEQLATRPWSTELEPWAPPQFFQQIATMAPITPANKKAYVEAMDDRAKRRAFEGAPPTIPHPVGQGSALECQVCHQRGVQIGSALAPPVSHPTYTMCTQCHVAETSPIPPSKPITGAASVKNDFHGNRTSPAPYRLAASAPPQVPHPTFMRERCDACHGPSGRSGLQTSHPARGVCQQCHVPSAVVDQRAMQ